MKREYGHKGNIEWEYTDDYKDKYFQIGSRDVAWYVVGYEVAADEDTEWTGIRERTGNVVVCMSGDDRYTAVDPDELKEIDAELFCGDCGQIGCGHSA